MSITKTEFGKTKKGEQVYSYLLDNGKGLSAEVINFGGAIRSIFVTDKNGNKTDVVLGHKTIEQYEERSGYLGAAVGRNANRIEFAKFTLNGKEYQLDANKKGHNLHGGYEGFSYRVWDVMMQDEEEPSIVLSLTSPDGDQGFPGTMDVTMTYTLTSDNQFVINYKATSDADTICNFTNHSYFNLSGHDSGTVYDQKLQMSCSFYTPGDATCVPTGEVLKVDGTPFDFREEKELGKDINCDYGMIKQYIGFDHNFAADGIGYRKIAAAKSDKTGITMEVYTDQPGIQLYTGNFLDPTESVDCKDGVTYDVHHAFCLETQNFPDAANKGHFPSPILKKGDVYDSTTAYKFIVK